MSIDPRSKTPGSCGNPGVRRERGQKSNRTAWGSLGGLRPLCFRRLRRRKERNYFSRRRTPGWSLLPLRGNSPSVRREKFLSRSEVSRPRLRRGKAPERRAIAIAPAEPGWGCLGERAEPFPRILSVRKCETGPPRWGGPVSRAVGLFFHSLWRLCRQSEEIPRLKWRRHFRRNYLWLISHSSGKIRSSRSRVPSHSIALSSFASLR